MSNFFSQLYKKSSTKNGQNTHANFSLQRDKMEEASSSHTQDEALRCLAKVLVEAYFKKKKYEREKQLH